MGEEEEPNGSLFRKFEGLIVSRVVLKYKASLLCFVAVALFWVPVSIIFCWSFPLFVFTYKNAILEITLEATTAKQTELIYMRKAVAEPECWRKMEAWLGKDRCKLVVVCRSLNAQFWPELPIAKTCQELPIAKRLAWIYCCCTIVDSWYDLNLVDCPFDCP